MDAPLTDLDSEEASFIVARGGRGGWGNRRFARATRQSPHFAQQGAAGERRRLRVELKLLADVGLVGLPNAGKSTLLRAWSAATPKVGGYAFTTLEPELGVVEVEYDAFVAADMPGLIEGASRGVGLGHEFLRHIERTRVLVHVLDMTREDPIADRAVVESELKQFGHGLAEKPRLLALNKIDDPDGRARMELLAETDAFGEPWVAVSSLTREGTPDLARRALETLRSMAAQPAGDTAGEPRVLRPPPALSRFNVRMEEGIAVISGSTPEWLAATLDIENAEARHELVERLRRMGVARALRREGVQPGDRVRIGDVELGWPA